METASKVIGTDNGFCRRVPMLLKEAGLTHVRATYRGHAMGDGSLAQALLSQSMAQLRPAVLNVGLGTEQELDELSSWLASNDVVDIAMMAVSAWGRKALRAGTRTESSERGIGPQSSSPRARSSRTRVSTPPSRAARTVGSVPSARAIV